MSHVKSDEFIRRVLIGPDLWLGFLIELDIPVPSDRIHEITSLDGNLISKIAMKALYEHPFFNEAISFTIDFNEHIKGVRIIYYV